MTETQPKLIVLNGPLGIGKSTLARMYLQGHPLSLAIDHDDIWQSIGNRVDLPQESKDLAWSIVIEMSRVVLSAGNNVCIAQSMTHEKHWRLLEDVAAETGARLQEVLLYAPKEESLTRFIARGKAGGHNQGFRPGGTIERNGGLKRVAELYDEINCLASKRPNTTVIESRYEDPQGALDQILSS